MSVRSWLGLWDERAIWRASHPTISVWRRIVKGHDDDEQKQARMVTTGDSDDSRTASGIRLIPLPPQPKNMLDPLRVIPRSAAKRVDPWAIEGSE